MEVVAIRAPEAAKFLGLSTSTLAKMRLRGDGPTFVKCGRRAVTYCVTDLTAWLQRNRRQSTREPKA